MWTPCPLNLHLPPRQQSFFLFGGGGRLIWSRCITTELIQDLDLTPGCTGWSQIPQPGGPHLRAAETQSGSRPRPSAVKPAWTDTLRHLISSAHSGDGILPTPRVKQFEPDSTSSAYPLSGNLCWTTKTVSAHFSSTQALRRGAQPEPLLTRKSCRFKRLF